jgi:hypothetical protein
MNIKAFRKHNESSAASIGLASVEAELMSVLSVPQDLDEQAERRRERDLGMKLSDHDPANSEMPYAPPAVIPLPAYVQHSPETTPTGAACGEAIVKEYELAAQEIEALGAELKAAHARSEERQRALAAALADLTETAKAYREEAKRVFEQIEACATMANDVSKTCEEIRAKIGKQ